MGAFYVFKKVLEEPFKCECGYETAVVFVLANDKIQADTKFEANKGLCANCLVDLIMDKGYKICSKTSLPKPAPRLKPKSKRFKR